MMKPIGFGALATDEACQRMKNILTLFQPANTVEINPNLAFFQDLSHMKPGKGELGEALQEMKNDQVILMHNLKAKLSKAPEDVEKPATAYYLFQKPISSFIGLLNTYITQKNYPYQQSRLYTQEGDVLLKRTIEPEALKNL